MKAFHVLSWLTFDHEKFPGEQSSDEVLTQPDEVLSVTEMLRRHARGIPVNSAFGPGEYYPEELGYVPDISSMDLSEIDEMRRELNARVRFLKQKEKADQPNLPRGERPPEAKEKTDQQSQDNPLAAQQAGGVGSEATTT